MADKMICRSCGGEFDPSHPCPHCGADTETVKLKVEIPVPRGAVNDYPGILTDEQVKELDATANEFFDKTKIPIVITIVHTTEPLAPPEYAFLMYNHWGIGKAGINKGLLILLCLKEQHVESEVGFGLEDILSENTGDEIIQRAFIPAFKDGKYFNGLKSGIKDLIDAIEKRVGR
jgi:uncharacterized protein